MASDVQGTNQDASLTSLLSGIVDDTQELIKQHLAMAKHEFSQELNRTKEAAFSLAIGLTGVLIGGVLLCSMLAYLLHEELGLKVWHGYGIVGVVVAAIGANLLYVARQKASKVDLVPEQTIETMKENAEWIKNHT
jgi:uncharacterized membrane protein YraQ (UPF0718 family)